MKLGFGTQVARSTRKTAKDGRRGLGLGIRRGREAVRNRPLVQYVPGDNGRRHPVLSSILLIFARRSQGREAAQRPPAGGHEVFTRITRVQHGELRATRLAGSLRVSFPKTRGTWRSGSFFLLQWWRSSQLLTAGHCRARGCLIPRTPPLSAEEQQCLISSLQ